MEYSEHDGVNLQLDGNTVEIMYWYNLTKAIISDFTAGTPFHSQTYDDYSGSARQTFSALCPSVLQHLSAPAGAHPGEKTVGLFPSAVMRVKCSICPHYKYPPLKMLNTNYKFPGMVKSTRTHMRTTLQSQGRERQGQAAYRSVFDCFGRLCFFSYLRHSWAEALNTSAEGRLLLLNPKALHP